MSKERLEEIKSRVWKDKGTYAMGDENQKEGYIYTLSDYDYKWLIEQAKQVSALETTIDFYQSALRDADRRVQELEVWRNEVTQNVVERNSEYEKCREQNKRYREAIILAHYKLGFGIDESVNKDERTRKIFEAKEILKSANVLEGEE